MAEKGTVSKRGTVPGKDTAQGKNPTPVPEETPAQEPTPSPAPAPAPEPTQEQQLAQILIKVPPEVKEKAQRQADLAFRYGWIKSATLTQLFIWETETFLDDAIRTFIARRRMSGENKTAQEVKSANTQ